MDFHAGDVVRLKSGGPRMTVYETNDFVWCVWITGNGENEHRSQFPAVAIVSVPD